MNPQIAAELRAILVKLTRSWTNTIEVMDMSITGTDEPEIFEITFKVKAVE